ncbi:MAG: hypothetical protein DLM55_02690 [Acidimicrobiales bacterium]|nr:MAG: hypothetical protein DLM55_02690 [Acidimicrobiales bacterium]
MSGYSTTYAPRKTSHLFHLVMTLFTGGLWGFFWIIAAVNAMRARKVTTVHYSQPLPQIYVMPQLPYAVYLNSTYYPLPSELEARRYVGVHGGTVVLYTQGQWTQA